MCRTRQDAASTAWRSSLACRDSGIPCGEGVSDCLIDVSTNLEPNEKESAMFPANPCWLCVDISDLEFAAQRIRYDVDTISVIDEEILTKHYNCRWLEM
jgi:hypothetical protein